MVDVKTVAGEAEKVVVGLQKAEPWIEDVLPFIPGASVAVPFVHMFAPVILTFAARALDDISKDKNGDLLAALTELFQHISKGQPNSPTLSVAGMPKADTP
jgi:hypothetical protein